MKKTLTKLLALTLALLMLLPFAVACGTGDSTDSDKTTETDTDGNVVEKPDTDLEIKIYALNGTTALGMAQLIDNVKNDKTNMNYDVSLHTSADAITGAIVSGE